MFFLFVKILEYSNYINVYIIYDKGILDFEFYVNFNILKFFSIFKIIFIEFILYVFFDKLEKYFVKNMVFRDFSNLFNVEKFNILILKFLF